HVVPSRMTGKIATDPLLSMARTKAARLVQYHASVGRGVGWPRAGGRLSSRRYASMEARQNSSASRFLRCAIHATDSTLTGCTANSSAARNAPGIANVFSVAQSNNAL